MVGIIVGVLIVSALAGVVTLGSRTAAATGTPRYRSLNIGIQAWQVTTFNPMAITLADEYIVVYSVYSTLLTNGPTYKFRGDLAHSWSVAPDNVTWTFHLVHGAYFIDPTNPSSTAHPVTAADVVFSYDLQINQTASILNAYTSDIVSVTALDPYTVQIVTDVPVATIYSTAINIPILPEYIWASITDPISYSPQYPIGSGAYYYDTTNSTTGLAVFKKNPHYYWDQYYCQVMKPDQIRFISYADSTAMVRDFQSGASQLNAIVGIDPSTYTTTLKSWQPKWAVDQGFVGEFAINAMTDAQRALYTSQGLTQFANVTPTNNQILANNWTVRRAIAMSINKTGLIQDALGGLGSVGDSLVPDSNPWHYTPPAQYQYHFNPAAARAMLNAAGWEWDANGNPATATTYPLYQKGTSNNTVYWPLIFRFYTLNTEDWWKKAAGDIVTWLNEAGIETTDRLGVPGFGAYSIDQMSGYWLSADYDMWLWDWIFTPASDPSTDILEVATTQAIGPTSDTFYSNATFDALYNQSIATLDPVARRAILNEMQMMLYNYSSMIIPFYKSDLYAALDGTPPTGSQGWTNWGNWTTHNGLTPDSELLNLWAQVDPTDNPAPVIESFPSVTWLSGAEATIGVTAYDPQAAYLNYSFNFGDGSPVYNTTTVPVTHTYANPGDYRISVRVANSEFPTCVSTSAQIVAAGTGNLPPQIYGFGANELTADRNQTLWFNVTAKDYEGDSLYVTWNFGDGSTATSYAATGTQAGVSLSATHTYPTAGTYKTVVTVTDNQTAAGLNHSPQANVTVTVLTISIGPGGGGGTTSQTNPLIEYGLPILIVVVVVVAVAAVVWRRRKRTKKEEAETAEPPQQGPPGSLPPP